MKTEDGAFNENEELRALMRNVQENADGCWIWTGALKHCRRGTHRYGWVGFRGRQVAAHRAFWTLLKGDIPKGNVVCHKCDIPACVNPDHLFLGTQADNMHDMASKGRKWVGPPIRKSDGLPARARLSTDDMDLIRKLRSGGMTQDAIAAQIGVSQGCISQFLRGVWAYAKR